MFEENQTAVQEAIASERTRIVAILISPEAEGRRDMARHLALETDTQPEQARSILAAAPKSAAATSSLFIEAMALVNDPDVGPDVGEGPEMTIQAAWNLVLHRAGTQEASHDR